MTQAWTIWFGDSAYASGLTQDEAFLLAGAKRNYENAKIAKLSTVDGSVVGYYQSTFENLYNFIDIVGDWALILCSDS